MQARGRHRGMALGTILLAMLVFSLVLFSAVSSSVSHLKLVEGTARGDHARNLAESALSQAIAELIASDFTFGKNGERVEVDFDGLEGTGVVTFSQSEFPTGYSTFNLDSDSDAVGAEAHPVPARTVHLVARGKVGSAERWMECYYYKPPFPDGLAAQGPVEASALYLAGVRTTQAYVPPPGQTAPDQILPANLFSNSAEGFTPGGPSVDVGVECIIKGSAGAVGAVNVDSTSIVEGEVSPGSERRPIPELNVTGAMDIIEPQAIGVVSTGFDLELNPKWYARSDVDLNVGGNLLLRGSALVVRGNLTVTGAVQGSGIILVEGEVKIGDGSNLSTTEQVAIGCTKDFKLSADTPDGNFFQGLLYTEGNLEANDITVLGATVANGKSPAIGSVKLDNVRMITAPGSVTTALRRPQGIVLKNLDDDPEYVGAVSYTFRRAPNGLYVDARAYFCDDEEVVANAGGLQDNPHVWLAAFPSGQPGMPDSADEGSNHFRTKSLAPVMIGTTAANRDLVKQQIADPLVQFFKDSIAIGTLSSGFPDEDQTRVSEAIISQVMSVASGTPDSYTISFNLNNLVREVNGTSRVLLWRPYKRRDS